MCRIDQVDFPDLGWIINVSIQVHKVYQCIIVNHQVQSSETSAGSLPSHQPQWMWIEKKHLTYWLVGAQIPNQDAFFSAIVVCWWHLNPNLNAGSYRGWRNGEITRILLNHDIFSQLAYINAVLIITFPFYRYILGITFSLNVMWLPLTF